VQMASSGVVQIAAGSPTGQQAASSGVIMQTTVGLPATSPVANPSVAGSPSIIQTSAPRRVQFFMSPTASSVVLPQRTASSFAPSSAAMSGVIASTSGPQASSSSDQATSAADVQQAEDVAENRKVSRTMSTLASRMKDINNEMTVAMKSRDTGKIQELMAERNKVTADQQQLRLHPQTSSSEDDSDDSDEVGEMPGPFRRASAAIAGFGSHLHARSSRTSVAQLTLRDRAMTVAEVNAETVSFHRNEILIHQFSHWITCFAILAVILTVALFGLFTWHVVEYIRYVVQQHVQCEGSVGLIGKIILGISVLNIVLGARVFCIEDEHRNMVLPTRLQMKNCCICILLSAMGVNLLGMLFLSTALSGGGSLRLQKLQDCKQDAPGLYVAVMAHAIGLLVYTIFLMVNFYGFASLLETLMSRGLLRTNGAAPEGALEHNTMPVRSLDDEDNECPICCEEMTVGDAVITKVCDHTFHKRCLAHWLRVNRMCPLCRENLGNVGLDL